MVLRVYERGHQKKSPAFAAAKGGENMNEPIRTQWEIRCAFNGFCKLALRREAMNAHRDTKQRQLGEIPFSDLSPQEENSFTFATNILQTIKRNSLSLSAARR